MWMRNSIVGKAFIVSLLGFAAVSYGAIVQGQEIDWNRARQLHQRAQHGEKLSPEDQAYYDRARREFERRNGAGNAPALTAKESTGLVPLTDLKEKYKGETGGLYGEGRNEPPKAHLDTAMGAAAKVRPLDGEGRLSQTGKVVLLAIGMSNTTQEFSTFKPLADSDPVKSPSLVLVDGAQGGQAADQWIDPDTNPQARHVWEVADERLKSAGVTPQQVQVVWIKQALIQQGRLGEFPAHAKHLQESLGKIVRLAKEHFPNLRLAYLSSRIYGGYATTQLNPEPYAYEGAYSVRWLIQDQMKSGALMEPLLLWGPYLWADGTKGRKDGLVWKTEDFGPDGTHPSPSGRRKVADQLLRFFKEDPTAKGWFVSKGLR